MKNLGDPLFLFFCILFVLNKTLETKGIFIPYIHAYMDDLICLPVILNITLFIFREYIYGSMQYKFPVFFIVTAVLMFALTFEIFLPSVSAAYTADPLDALAYAAGGIFFHFRFNRRIPAGVIS